MIQLSPSDINQYYEKGYICIKGMYTAQEIEDCRAIIERDIASGGWMAAPYASENVTTDIYERLPDLANIVFNENYVSVVKQIFSNEPVILAEPAIHKSRYYYWHKDSTFISEQNETYHLSKDFQAAMTVMYLQENHPDFGGGITLVPGTQWTDDFFAKIPQLNIAQRAILKLQKLLKISHFDRLDQHKDLLPVPTEVGDVLFIDMRLDHKGTPAKKVSPVTKYGIMNIACDGKKAAKQLQNTLRNRPSNYYSKYLKNQPDTTPVLADLANKHDVEIVL